MVFTNAARDIGLWALPIDADNARAAGQPRRVTQADVVGLWPHLSADGRWMGFNTYRSRDDRERIAELCCAVHALLFIGIERFGKRGLGQRLNALRRGDTSKDKAEGEPGSRSLHRFPKSLSSQLLQRSADRNPRGVISVSSRPWPFGRNTESAKVRLGYPLTASTRKIV
jgi:hypothetical protein